MISVLLVIIHLLTPNAPKPLVVLSERGNGIPINPTFVLYGNGTVLKNLNDPYQLPNYVTANLDSSELSSLVSNLQIESLNFDSKYFNCEPSVTDRNTGRLTVFTPTDTLVIEVYGFLRQYAFRYSQLNEIPECPPESLTKSISVLLNFEHHNFKPWLPNKFTDGTNTYDGDRLEWYRSVFGNRNDLRFILPSEEIWKKVDL